MEKSTLDISFVNVQRLKNRTLDKWTKISLTAYRRTSLPLLRLVHLRTNFPYMRTSFTSFSMIISAIFSFVFVINFCSLYILMQFSFVSRYTIQYLFFSFHFLLISGKTRDHMKPSEWPSSSLENTCLQTRLEWQHCIILTLHKVKFLTANGNSPKYYH